MQALYDSAVQDEVSSNWAQAADGWKACVNETLRQMEECRVQCEVASQRLPEDRGVDSVSGVLEKAAGERERTPAEASSLPRNLSKEPRRRLLFCCVRCSSVTLPARMSTVLCDSGGHQTWENLLPRRLPAVAAGALAHRPIQR